MNPAPRSSARGLVLGVLISLVLWAGIIWAAITIAHTGLIGAFIDGASQVPFLVWLLLVGCAVLIWLAVLSTTEVTTPEQREEIARVHREWTGGRGMQSTRSTAPPRGGTSRRHPNTRGQVGPALGRPDPRRAR